jgi:hypothetical protein
MGFIIRVTRDNDNEREIFHFTFVLGIELWACTLYGGNEN